MAIYVGIVLLMLCVIGCGPNENSNEFDDSDDTISDSSEGDDAATVTETDSDTVVVADVGSEQTASEKGDADTVTDGDPGVERGTQGSDSDEPDTASDCVVRDAPLVQCGGDVCEGDTPLCCKHTSTENYLGCVDSKQSCTDLTHELYPELINTTEMAYFGIFECEDAADCPQGEVCCDQFNKGRSFYEGSTCETTCDVFMYGRQLCSQSCECRDGLSCEPYEEHFYEGICRDVN